MTIPQIIERKEVSEAQATRLRREANAVAKAARKQEWDLGGLILRASYDYVVVSGKPQALYQRWGYRTFGEWVETELHVSRKKAERLRHVWWVFEDQLKGAWTRSQLLGFCKMRELARVATRDNVSALLDWARTVSYYDVEREVAKLGADLKPDLLPRSERYITMNAKLTKEEMDEVQALFSSLRCGSLRNARTGTLLAEAARRLLGRGANAA
jgi:hypothetical protein